MGGNMIPTIFLKQLKIVLYKPEQSYIPYINTIFDCGNAHMIQFCVKGEVHIGGCPHVLIKDCWHGQNIYSSQHASSQDIIKLASQWYYTF